MCFVVVLPLDAITTIYNVKYLLHLPRRTADILPQRREKKAAGGETA